MSQWKPIETAPKDGTIFFSHWKTMPVLVAWADGAFRVLTPFSRPTAQLVVHGNFAPFTPTHWMPLPKPPTPPEVK